MIVDNTHPRLAKDVYTHASIVSAPVPKMSEECALEDNEVAPLKYVDHSPAVGLKEPCVGVPDGVKVKALVLASKKVVFEVTAEFQEFGSPVSSKLTYLKYGSPLTPKPLKAVISIICIIDILFHLNRDVRQI